MHRRWAWLPRGILLCSLLLAIDVSDQREPPSIHITEILERFARQNKVNVLADYYATEHSSAVWREASMLQSLNLQTILQLYRRNLAVQIGNTFVLMRSGPVIDSHDAYVQFNERRAEQIFGSLFWQNAKLDVRVKKEETGAMRVTIRASDVSIKQLCEQFEKQTGWKIEVDAEVANKRVFAYWDSASPGEILEAISVLLQTPVQAKLLLTQQQKEARKDAFQRMLEEFPLAKRWQRSDELLPDLLSALTPEERQQYQRGEMVRLDLSRLSGEVYERALQYVAFAIEQSIAQDPSDRLLASLRDRLREVEIALFLPSVDRDMGTFATGIGIGIRHPEDGIWAYF